MELETNQERKILLSNCQNLNKFFIQALAQGQKMTQLFQSLKEFNQQNQFQIISNFSRLIKQRPIILNNSVVFIRFKEVKNIERNMSKNKVQPVVQNVVSFAKLQTEGNTELELKLIAQKVSGSRYNKKRFPAVILRKTKPRSTILIFKSGRMIIIGSESQVDAQLAAQRISKEIKKLTNKKIKLTNFKVTNIVANADLGHKINIGKLSQQDELTRKDDSFPGAVYHMDKPVKAVLIFSSGKVVFTGAQKRDQIDQAFNQLILKMKPYYKTEGN